MGMFSPPTKRGAFNQRVLAKQFLGTPITSFLGINNSANILNQLLGQLFFNKNMEYKFSGDNIFLKTKRGSTLISDITNKSFGASLYTYNLTTEKFVWIDESNIKVADTDGENETTINASLESNTQTYFSMYGEGTNSALYGVNGTEMESDKGVFKIAGEDPSTVEFISSPAMDFILYSSLLGRNIGLKGHRMHWSEIQVVSGTGNLENWGDVTLGYNNALISPDEGEGFKAGLDMGISGIWLFKNNGIWIFPNGNESEVSAWRFPKATADIGTQSPKALQAVNFGGKPGCIYVGSDKTLRFFAPEVSSYSAGELPRVIKSDSKIISKTFQSTLDQIPDSKLSLLKATYWDRYYILNIYKDGASTQLDKTIVIDCEKVIKRKGDDFAQPFWFESENMNYSEMLIKRSDDSLYGFSEEGYIARLFVDDKFVEEMPTRIEPTQEFEDSGTTRTVAIEYSAYTAWHDFTKRLSRGAMLELNSGYLNWETGGDWGITFHVNAFKRGDEIPSFNQGLSTDLPTPNLGGAGLFDVSLFDVAFFADSGSASQEIQQRNRGHYFLFGFTKTDLNEWASIFSIDPIFKQYTNDPIGIR